MSVILGGAVSFHRRRSDGAVTVVPTGKSVDLLLASLEHASKYVTGDLPTPNRESSSSWPKPLFFFQSLCVISLIAFRY